MPFADASALVKLYADEDGSEMVRRLRGPVVCSSASGVEVPAAFWRKTRMGELAVSDAQCLVETFAADLLGTHDEEPTLVEVAITPMILQRARELVARHPLRAYDAIQLATACEVRNADPMVNGFVCFDRSLCDVARRERFDVPVV